MKKKVKSSKPKKSRISFTTTILLSVVLALLILLALSNKDRLVPLLAQSRMGELINNIGEASPADTPIASTAPAATALPTTAPKAQPTVKGTAAPTATPRASAEPSVSCSLPDNTVNNQITQNQKTLTSLQKELSDLSSQIDTKNASGEDTTDLYSEYQDKANEFNSLNSTTSKLITQYNDQVDSYNACIGL